MAASWMDLDTYTSGINYSGPEDSRPRHTVSFHDGPDHPEVNKTNYFKERAKIDAATDSDGNSVQGANRSGSTPSIARGKIYYPKMVDEVRELIEPFGDPWLDPGILVGPGPAPFGMEPPITTPNPYPITFGGRDAVDNIVTSEYGKGPIITEHIETLPEPVKVYVMKAVMDLTKWKVVNTRGLRDVVEGKLSGAKLDNVIANATAALHLNVIDQNLQAIDDVLDNVHESTKEALEKYTILMASSEANIKSVNHMIDRMATEHLNTVIDEVVNNLMSSVAKIPHPEIQEDARAWVEKMTKYPDWSAKAMLNLPQEYQPITQVKQVLVDGLKIAEATRDAVGAVSATIDQISDVADELSEYQVSVAVAI